MPLPTLELFTLDEVARTFRVSPRTMREHVKRYPFYRVLGGRKLFTSNDIKALTRKRRKPSGHGENGKSSNVVSLGRKQQPLSSARP
jgi:hypothetical protein